MSHNNQISCLCSHGYREVRTYYPNSKLWPAFRQAHPCIISLLCSLTRDGGGRFASPTRKRVEGTWFCGQGQWEKGMGLSSLKMPHLFSHIVWTCRSHGSNQKIAGRWEEMLALESGFGASVACPGIEGLSHGDSWAQNFLSSLVVVGKNWWQFHSSPLSSPFCLMHVLFLARLHYHKFNTM